MSQTLLPDLIDKLAEEAPDAVWGEFPTSPHTFENGFTTISYREFANAVIVIAHCLRQALPDAADGETLAYLAPSDPRCTISLVAAMKAGFNVSHNRVGIIEIYRH